MKIPDGRIEYLDGHLWLSQGAIQDAIVRDHIRSVVGGTCPEDEFWEMIGEEADPRTVTACRRFIAEGGLVRTPAKPSPDEIEHDAWYWVQHGRNWEIGRADKDDGLRFGLTTADVRVPYADIIDVGPRVEDHEDEEAAHDHDGDHGDCPLCPSAEKLSRTRADNMSREKAARDALSAEIEANPSAFVHVIEGYEDAGDRSPIITFVASTADQARRHLESYSMSEGRVFEVTPHRLDAERTGETVMFHCTKRDGQLIYGEGRHYPEKNR